MNGIRTNKTVDGIETTYFVLNDKILAEKSDGKDIVYHYSSDKLIGFAFNGVEYIYERNIQRDVLRIYQKDDLTLVAEYNYDAYGNHVVINHTANKMGNVNPFRYRGYFFDVETDWYYLDARYCSPTLGRFISSDKISIFDETKSQINGLNLYMYCGDNPIEFKDDSGHGLIMALIIGAIVGAVTNMTAKFAGEVIQNTMQNGFNFSQWSFSSANSSLLAGATGAISGMISVIVPTGVIG